MNRNFWDMTNLAAAALFGALLLAAGYVAKFGPEGPLPMHFNLHGEPDRWGSRTEAAWVLAGMALVMGLIHVLLSLRAIAVDPAMRRTFDTTRVLNVFVFTLFGALSTAMGLGKVYQGEPQRVLTTLAVLIAVVLVVTGASTGKAKPNPYLGVRVYWTLKSRLAWDRANRLLGRTYFLGGLASLVLLPLGEPRHALWLAVAVAIGGAAISIFESWRVWRADPERLV